MKITQITSAGTVIYGLGDDGELYIWNISVKAWDNA